MNTFDVRNGYPVRRPQGVAIASLVCGCVGFLLNPIGLCTLAAIVCGLIALLSRNQGGKGMATTGLILGCIHIPLEIILAMFTFGATLFF